MDDSPRPKKRAKLEHEAEQEVALPPPGADPQAASLFFTVLPQEIRDEIYSYSQVFLTTRLDFADLRPAYDHHRLSSPHMNLFSIIYTCRRARQEIGTSWLENVTVSFKSTYTMLYRLTAFSLDIIGSIRHLRITTDTVSYTRRMGRGPGGIRAQRAARFSEDTPYTLASALAFLPGLRLDSLTIISATDEREAHRILEMLVECAQGGRGRAGKDDVAGADSLVLLQDGVSRDFGGGLTWKLVREKCIR